MMMVVDEIQKGPVMSVSEVTLYRRDQDFHPARLGKVFWGIQPPNIDLGLVWCPRQRIARKIRDSITSVYPPVSEELKLQYNLLSFSTKRKDGSVR